MHAFKLILMCERGAFLFSDRLKSSSVQHQIKPSPPPPIMMSNDIGFDEKQCVRCYALSYPNDDTCCCWLYRVWKNLRDAPIFLSLLCKWNGIDTNAIQWFKWRRIHSINRSGKRVENNKMNLDTLIDFNCIVLHFMEISRWRQSSTVIVGWYTFFHHDNKIECQRAVRITTNRMQQLVESREGEQMQTERLPFMVWAIWSKYNSDYLISWQRLGKSHSINVHSDFVNWTIQWEQWDHWRNKNKPKEVNEANVELIFEFNDWIYNSNWL